MLFPEHETAVLISDSLNRSFEGSDPFEVVIEDERKKSVASDLEILLGCLSENQKAAFLLNIEGWSNKKIGKTKGASGQAVGQTLAQIPKVFEKVADEKKIIKLKEQIAKLEKKNITPKRREQLEELTSDLEHRLAVREALKRLFSELQPKPSMKEISSSSATDGYTFEKLMNVQVGLRMAHRNDGNYYVPVTKCMIPEYLRGSCVCTWCVNCKRKADNKCYTKESPIQ